MYYTKDNPLAFGRVPNHSRPQPKRELDDHTKILVLQNELAELKRQVQPLLDLQSRLEQGYDVLRIMAKVSERSLKNYIKDGKGLDVKPWCVKVAETELKRRGIDV